MATHSSILAWRIPRDRGAWWATVHRVPKSQTQLKQLSMQAQCQAQNKAQWLFLVSWVLDQNHRDQPAGSTDHKASVW